MVDASIYSNIIIRDERRVHGDNDIMFIRVKHSMVDAYIYSFIQSECYIHGIEGQEGPTMTAESVSCLNGFCLLL